MRRPRPGEILRLSIHSEQDVYLARQRGRDVAALVGLVNQDQVRVATAISELSREICMLPGAATITLSLADRPAPALVITAEWTGRLPGGSGSEPRATDLAAVEGFAAAARLTDTHDVISRSDGGSVALTKRLPPDAGGATAEHVERLRRECRARPVNSLDALRSQNQDLLDALEHLQARQEDLVRANSELEETNRGVLAMHAELSDELEQTNRGVVALYAELDEATTRLREASESKTRFWAGVSHELRTPLNSVLGLSRLLLDPGSDPLTADQRYQIELISDSGSMLLSLVNDLLDVAKAESGQIEPHPEPTDVSMIIDHVRAAVEPLLASSDVVIVVDRPDRVEPVVTDPVLLGRILRNLLSNAVKFTRHGEIRCAVRPDRAAGAVEITVSDTGIGIPLEHQGRVFEEFYQVRSELQPVQGGTGLGLPYARRVAEILGGSLGLSSEPGRGTVMTLRLPFASEERPPEQLSAVLVVDDDPAFRLILRHALDGHATAVTEADNGTDALRRLREHRPDLVLLDLDIPAPDGAAVLAEMRRDPALHRLPVVVITATDLDADRRAALGATAAVLGKAQFTPDLLLSAAAAANRLVGGTT
ncbi:ATP-binding protein [Pseudonocardia sp. GCM10023141]|uniref:ATP-binding protein n=1 Tax=Pseudonocardia sp. GCM10023141 TaxID=3252653 RepID=UPI003614BD6D